MPEQTVSRPGRNIAKACIFAWLAVTNAETFIESAAAVAARIPPEGLMTEKDLRNPLVKALSLHIGGIYGASTSAVTAYNVYAGNANVCGAFTLSAQAVKTVKNYSPVAANIIALNQTIAGFPGRLVGGILVGVGNGFSELVTGGAATNPRSCL